MTSEPFKIVLPQLFLRALTHQPELSQQDLSAYHQTQVPSHFISRNSF